MQGSEGLDNSSVVFTPALDDDISTPAAADSISHCREQCVSVLSYLAEFLENSLATQSLISEWLHELFVQLEQYNSEPPKEIQQSWLGFPIIGAATSSTLIALLMNHYYEKKNPGKHLAAEDYLAKLFSSSFLYFAMDTLSKSGAISAISLPAFFTISAFGLPMVAASFLKIASPPSNQYTCPWSAHFNPTRYSAVSEWERALNAGKAVKNAFFSANTLAWVINRELSDETVPLAKWQIVALLFFLVGAGKIGYEHTTHPKFYQGFSAFLILCETGALIYAAISGILLMAVVYSCADRQFCVNESSKDFLSCVCAAIALPLAFHKAAFMRIRFEEEHTANEKIISWFGAKKTTAVEGCETAFKKASNGFYFFTRKISACCSSENEQDNAQDENNSLMQASMNSSPA